MRDYVIRATASNGQVRAFVGSTTNMVELARTFHNTTPVASAALGRTLIATSIMGLMMKNDNDKITIIIKGGGPIGSIVTTADSNGMVKGYVTNPDVDVPLKYAGKLDVGAAVGNNGSIKVIKDLGLREPYNGSYPLVNGEIAEDFTSYFTFSEQTPSAVALGVLVDVDRTIKAAGGFIIQLMPDATEEVISKLEENIGKIDAMSKLIEAGKTPEEILNLVLEGLNPEILQKHEVGFECDCSKERFEKALITIGKNDIQEILEEDKSAEIGCHFCNVKYNFDEEDLKKILEKM
jgi:molecular chaperone Hsp33